MHREGADDDSILSELEQALEKDHIFSGGKVLSPMMSTPLPIVLPAHRMFFEANLGNPGLYPGTKGLEDTVIGWMGELLHAPPTVVGQVTSGGTESNITALWMAKKHTGKKRVIFSAHAHFSLPKACDMLSMEPVEIPLDDEFLPDLDVLEREVGKGGVACVIGIACTTELGLLEPIELMGHLARDSPFHVDAAFGGFVLPFMNPSPPAYDFKVGEVDFISLDPHKMGGAAIPAGALLLREPEAV
ncbi:MAG: tyrosine decarboxylase MfnA, partial [Thermoplasmata archaeon]|nr:tyrosine decarboxylase MfnA [Thermoplasmata archaeon]